MRIIFITSKLNFQTAGGSIEEFDLMIRTLQSLGNDLKVITVFPNSNVITEPLPYPVIVEPVKTTSLWSIQKGCYEILKKYSDQADAFHIDGQLFLYGAGFYRLMGGRVPVEGYFNRELACWPECRSSLFPYTQPSFLKKLRGSLRSLIEKYIGMPIARHIDVACFTCTQLQAMYHAFGLRTKCELVVGDPIQVQKRMDEQGITEQTYRNRNKTDGPITLFYSSRMAPGKGFDMLLTGFSHVKDKEKYYLILGGSGPEEPLIKDMVKKLGLERYVELPGWVERPQLFEHYKKADIFIQTEWRVELTSISLIYAMLFGVPSIIPANTGLTWDTGPDGALMFKHRDPQDLARAIEELGNDPTLRAKISENAYRRLHNNEMKYDVQIRRMYLAICEASGKA